MKRNEFIQLTTHATPTRETYVAWVPSDDTPIHWVYRGCPVGYTTVTMAKYTSLRSKYT